MEYSQQVLARSGRMRGTAKRGRIQRFVDRVGCAWCGGTGQDGKLGSRCSVCGGNGNIKLAAFVVACMKCAGSGMEGGALTCLACRGIGVVPVRAGAGACPKCRGTGEQGVFYCEGCKGQGVV